MMTDAYTDPLRFEEAWRIAEQALDTIVGRRLGGASIAWCALHDGLAVLRGEPVADTRHADRRDAAAPTERARRSGPAVAA